MAGIYCLGLFQIKYNLSAHTPLQLESLRCLTVRMRNIVNSS